MRESLLSAAKTNGISFVRLEQNFNKVCAKFNPHPSDGMSSPTGQYPVSQQHYWEGEQDFNTAIILTIKQENEALGHRYARAYLENNHTDLEKIREEIKAIPEQRWFGIWGETYASIKELCQLAHLPTLRCEIDENHQIRHDTLTDHDKEMIHKVFKERLPILDSLFHRNNVLRAVDTQALPYKERMVALQYGELWDWENNMLEFTSISKEERFNFDQTREIAAYAHHSSLRDHNQNRPEQDM